MEEFKKFTRVEDRLIFAGLTAISLIILQDWIATGAPDLSSQVSLIALSVSIPILVFNLLLLQVPGFHSNELAVIISRFIGVLGVPGAGIGITAAIYHVSPIAGGIFFLSGNFCFFIYYAAKDEIKKSLQKEENKKLTEQTITE